MKKVRRRTDDSYRLAQQITRRLFTPGDTRLRAEQLRLMVDGQYLCGWRFGPARDAILRIIERSRGTTKS